MYFGAELPADDPRVLAGTPLHGPNLFPAEPEGFREAVLGYMAALTGLGHRLLAGLALSLGLEEWYFDDRITGEPLTLFRIFNYPPPADPTLWGVGEHTDYGLLTILLQDDAGGLEVKSRSRWVPAPPVPGSFVCNIGDMLDRMSGGLFRSTPHRVRNPAPRDRLSFPFFFDPNFFARVRPIERGAGPPSRRPGRALGPRQRPCVRGDLRRLPVEQGWQGVPRVAVGGALITRVRATATSARWSKWRRIEQ